MGGNRFWQLHLELRLGSFGFIQEISFHVCHARSGEGEGTKIRSYDFQLVTCAKFVVQTADSKSGFVTGLNLGTDLPLPYVAGMLSLRKIAIKSRKNKKILP